MLGGIAADRDRRRADAADADGDRLGVAAAESFATGSAVVNMFRQIGLAVGVAVLIAVLGSPHSPAATLAAYQRAWIVTAAIAFAGGVVGLVLLTARRRPADLAAQAAPAASAAPAAPAATSGSTA